MGRGFCVGGSEGGEEGVITQRVDPTGTGRHYLITQCFSPQSGGGIFIASFYHLTMHFNNLL